MQIIFRFFHLILHDYNSEIKVLIMKNTDTLNNKLKLFMKEIH